MPRYLLLFVVLTSLVGVGCDKKTDKKPAQPVAETNQLPPPATIATAEPKPAAVLTPTTTKPAEPVHVAAKPPTEAPDDGWIWQTEQFGDVRILRYRVAGFDSLDLNTKKLLYYLYEASLCGRDITWDQNHAHGLAIRQLLEAVVETYSGDKQGEDYKKLLDYTKAVWFGSGIHHHRSNQKLSLELSAAQLAGLVKASAQARLPLAEGQSVDQLLATLTPILIDPAVDPMKVSRDAKGDLVKDSATNYYGRDLTQAEVEGFYAKRIDKSDKRPVMHGLNTRLTKRDGTIVEEVWKVGGRYGAAIAKMVGWLEKASSVAENAGQKAWIDALVTYYKSGELKDFDAFNIAWVGDTESTVDMIHGFIESYGDPMDMRGSYEAILSVVDPVASLRIKAISADAQWFEDHSPIADAHKKEKVTGIAARVINVVVGSGDAQPTFPIGVNLPNSDWIRAEHGSKSVNLGNIVESYEEASKASGLLEEFAESPEEVARIKKYGPVGDKLHTDMHEVIGHASGKLNEGVGTPSETLKNFAGTLEEARADLVALYYLMDPKLIELGVMESLDVGRAAYDDYFRTGLLVQLARVKLGSDLQDTHMRNRQLNAAWVYEKGRSADGKGKDVVEKLSRDGKTYYKVHDYERARELFGQLLAETQRIKSMGDYAAAKALVETYGVKIDQTIHAEVLARYKKLGIAPYGGFINPRLTAVMEGADIVAVEIDYPTDYATQMLEYSRDYAFVKGQ